MCELPEVIATLVRAFFPDGETCEARRPRHAHDHAARPGVLVLPPLEARRPITSAPPMLPQSMKGESCHE
jgi:hypothetical protein